VSGVAGVDPLTTDDGHKVGRTTGGDGVLERVEGGRVGLRIKRISERRVRGDVRRFR
jgi:hypothetical protein